MAQRAPLSGQRDRPVVVTVVAVHVVQVAIDQIIDVIPMRDSLMPTPRPMNMGSVVATTAMIRGARGRVGRVNSEDMLVNMVAMGVVQMTVMQVVDMTLMQDGGVAAAWTMGVCVVVVRHARCVVCHRLSLRGGVITRMRAERVG